MYLCLSRIYMTMKAVHSFRCTAFFIQSLIFFLCRRYVYVFDSLCCRSISSYLQYWICSSKCMVETWFLLIRNQLNHLCRIRFYLDESYRYVVTYNYINVYDYVYMTPSLVGRRFCDTMAIDYVYYITICM